MKAEILTIGDEILIGQIVDTNSAWIAERLNKIGITIFRITSVGDNNAEIKNAIDRAFSDVDIVIITGGLGPTKDDITKNVLAEYFECKMTLDQKTLDHVTEMLTKRGIEVNANNYSQAMLPSCCTPLRNSNGTAPGMYFQKDNKILVSLPGVPFEMKSIIEEEFIPLIIRRFGLGNIVHRTVITFGLAESILAQTIEKWEDNLPKYIKLAYLPNPKGIRLRLSSYTQSKEIAREDIDTAVEELKTIIPEYFLGDEPISVESCIADILKSNKETLSVAESCTGGYISSRFTMMSGASHYYLGSVTSYSNEVKINLLNVRKEDIESYGAVSETVALQMAEGIRSITGSTYSIATTGVAGPEGGSIEKPVGTVWMAISTPEGSFAKKMVFGKLREQNIERASSNAINMLRLYLIGKYNTKVTGGVL